MALQPTRSQQKEFDEMCELLREADPTPDKILVKQHKEGWTLAMNKEHNSMQDFSRYDSLIRDLHTTIRYLNRWIASA